MADGPVASEEQREAARAFLLRDEIEVLQHEDWWVDGLLEPFAAMLATREAAAIDKEQERIRRKLFDVIEDAIHGL